MGKPADGGGGTNTVKAEDVEVRDVGRRAFLMEVGLIAGMAGSLAGCGGSDKADTDTGDPFDFDPTDAIDRDSGDPVDND